MSYRALPLLFPTYHSFEHNFVARAGTPSWPYPVSLCLGWCSGESFYSVRPRAKDKCHHRCILPEQWWDPTPAQGSVQGAQSFVPWGLYGDEQGHALQMELLVRTRRWVRHGSGAKTGLRYPYSDLNKLHPTASSSVWICLAVEMSFVVHPTIHARSLGMWCSSLPSHASKISSRESQDLEGDHTYSSRSLHSCLWGSSPATPRGTRIPAETSQLMERTWFTLARGSSLPTEHTGTVG